MKEICCDECGKFLFETDKSTIGATGALATSLGFVFKMPFLFTDKYSSLFFCDHDCAKLFFGKNIPKNEKATAMINELKAEIPDMVEQTCKGLSQMSEQLKAMTGKNLV